MFDRDAYLERVGLAKPPSTSAEGLARLHRAQLETIPFENLDVLAGRGVDVAPEAIFDKTVKRRRGGYCFELNGLFLQALQAFGFDARALLGRVHMGPEPGGRTHQVSLVRLDGRAWIADVGFGAWGTREPLPLEPGAESVQPDGTYRLAEAEPWGTALELDDGSGWRRLYTFDSTHVCRGDIETGNHYTATHPGSIFRRMRVVSRCTPEGRVSLIDSKLVRTSNGRREETDLEPGAACDEALRVHFGLELPS